MPIWKFMKGTASGALAEGLLYHDFPALTPCQRECTNRIGRTIQLEQEAYLTEHPEVKAMIEIFVSKMTQSAKRKDILKEAALHFARPAEEIDCEVRERLGVPPEGPYTKTDKPPFKYDDANLENDIKKIMCKHYPPASWVVQTSPVPTPDTPSSTFVSIITSDTTLPTPEPIPTPEPTLSEIFFNVISNTVDKAIYSGVEDKALRYDTAYVELMKCVEEAMEIPVYKIKEDIAEMFYNAYKMFEILIQEKERAAAEIAWEKRMRKKLKRTLRRMDNFKGYESPAPPSPKSEISSHESYKKPPPKPCVCHPQFNYNRYSKDRFGIYLPREEEFSDKNMTVTPVMSIENIPDAVEEEKADTKSIMSRKSVTSKKTTFE